MTLKRELTQHHVAAAFLLPAQHKRVALLSGPGSKKKRKKRGDHEDGEKRRMRSGLPTEV